MSKDAIRELDVSADAWFVDATFGGGGHTSLILKKGGKSYCF